MPTPNELFDEFRALINPNLFNIAVDTLESIEVRNWLTNAIQHLFHEANEGFEKHEHTNAGVVLKLMCELASTSTLMRNCLVFAAYLGTMVHRDPSTQTAFMQEDYWGKTREQLIETIDDNAIHWIIEFARTIDPKRIPDLITELEKIGFERS